MDIVKKLAKEFNIRPGQAESTVALINEGNTIPFIARYRKEATGGLSDVTLRELDERLSYLKNLEERKDEVIRLIGEQGKLTPELEGAIREAEILQRVEDLYKPYKQKKATRASKARERGLEPLAMLAWAQELEDGDPLELAGAYVDPEKGVGDAAAALAGAMDIIAEMISDDPDIIGELREKTRRTGELVAKAADPEEKTVYETYYDFSERASRIPDHRVLALNRGEKEKKLKVSLRTEAAMFTAAIEEMTLTNPSSIFADLIRDAAADSYKRLIEPALEREIRNALTERAEAEAVKVFARNTESLLMTPPVKGVRVIAIDPGFRTGCKVAALSETGKLQAYATVYPTEPRKDVAGAMATLKKLVDKYGTDVIAIGNGTGSRETEEVVAAFIRQYESLREAEPGKGAGKGGARDVGKRGGGRGERLRYTIVNEAGASVYSASKLATEEYPDLDVTTRGAMSLGRRLQDPMAELVKIPPKSIGVGQYQHDINQGKLESALGGVVENCVNRVGVDLNTASASLLSYVAGVNAAVARNIVNWRDENGGFDDRRQLKKVPKLGEKAFAQCAGFLRISGGKNPLDSTSVHPESYAAAREILKRAKVTDEEIARGGATDIEERLRAAYGVEPEGTAGLFRALAGEIGVGYPTLLDIIAEIKKPARDPREDAPPVVFRQDVKGLEDLRVGMELQGTVRNVVDFGAFVDIGVKNDGLVHISRMSGKFVRHPMDVVSVGDNVRVWIESIDPERHKIGLSMVKPEGGPKKGN
ncbi:MAG: RNA-binding transcriptional accessory protein [Clostridiales Family XIII bacterium]|jgi:uncharacterized protein|nr:RNA-binding transcriptional accessory protein [Clostridiales Family XIII bacterium]